jgi:hypothetical protein
MRRAYGLLYVVVLLGQIGPVRAGGPPSPEQTIDRALQAHGGLDLLSKLRAVTMKGKGTFFAVGPALPYTGEWAFQGPDRWRFDVAMTVKGKVNKLSQAVAGATGWRKYGDMEPNDLSRGELEEIRAEMYAAWVATLAPLKDKAFKLTALGEIAVEGRPTHAFMVEKQGRRPVTLSFDKKTHLLVKSACQIPENDPKEKKAREINQELYYHDYRTVAGVRLAGRVVAHRDGKRFAENEYTEIRLLERLDDSTFARP